MYERRIRCQSTIDVMTGEHKMTGAKEIIKKILGKDVTSKDAAPPVKKAAVAAPKPTPKTTTGWKPIPAKK